MADNQNEEKQKTDPIGELGDSISSAKDTYDKARDLKNLYDRANNLRNNADAVNAVQTANNIGQATAGQIGVGSAAGAGIGTAGSAVGAETASAGSAVAGASGASATGSTVAAAGATEAGAATATSAVATGATTGSSAGPAGTVVGAAVGAATALAKPVGEFVFGCIFAAIFMFLILCGGLIRRHESSAIRNYVEVEYGNSVEGDTYRADSNYKFTKDKNRDVINTDYDFKEINKKAMLEYKKATDEAVNEAFSIQLTWWVQHFDQSFGEKVLDKIKSFFSTKPTENHEKDLECFYKAKYPYCRAYEYNKYYTIGDYLYTTGYSGDSYNVFSKHSWKTIPDADLNNDLNYAEILAVLSEGTKFNTDNCTIQDYKAIFTKNQDTMEHLYEMKLTEWYKVAYDKKEQNGTNPDGSPKYEIKTKHFNTKDLGDSRFKSYDNTRIVSYWFEPTIYPFGLKELYELADANPDDPFQYSKYQTNKEHIDWIERLDRLYCRMDTDGDGVISVHENYLGPGFEDQRYNGWSLIYHKGKPDKVTTGRSADYYIDPSEQVHPSEYPDAPDDSYTPPPLDIPDDVEGSTLYKALLKHGFSAQKSMAMSIAYYALEPQYGGNFAIGVMANINSEGTCGRIEGLNGYKYWDYAPDAVIALADKQKYIKHGKDIDTMLTIPHGVEGIGVGMIQWSGSRRVTLLQIYKSMFGSQENISSADCMKAEIQMLVTEFAGKYHGVVAESAGQSAEKCSENVTKHYEIPAHKETAAELRKAVIPAIKTAVEEAAKSEHGAEF